MSFLFNKGKVINLFHAKTLRLLLMFFATLRLCVIYQQQYQVSIKILISQNLCNLCLKITFAQQLNTHYV